MPSGHHNVISTGSPITYAYGNDGPAVRTAAAEKMRRLGMVMKEMPSEQLRIDVGRRAGGGSFWIVWVREDLMK